MVRSRTAIVVLAAAALVLPAVPSAAAPAPPVKEPVAVGTGGAVVSDTIESTDAGLAVLKAGGTAADAAVAVA
ncbi:MAG TPA: gamma-glutamyltransferase, partial [Pseudonocardiaceae bacterium]|nr:gamma-glutamyltransferase [Pseudonocardiaceae bacterium]